MCELLDRLDIASLNENEVVSTCDQLFSTMLGMECSVVTSLDRFEHKLASVDILGENTVEVHVRISDDLALEIAHSMFGDGEVSNEDINDACGEVANMVGGNIKGMFKADCKLTLPTVQTPTPPGGQSGMSIQLMVQGYPLQVGIYERIGIAS